MSPISLCLNLLLASLLLATLMLGWRLNRQLKALKDSHASFAVAVGDLNLAATRAERGLSELRATTDETMDLLMGRIEKGRELAAKLERLNQAAIDTLARAPAPVPQPTPQQVSPQIAALERIWAKPANEQPGRAPADPEAAAESLVLKLSEALNAGPAAARRAPTRSRAMIDDDLFETPAHPARAIGGMR